MNFQAFCQSLGAQEPEHSIIGKRYFFDPANLLKTAESWDVFSVGIYLGEMRKEFSPTSALVEILGKNSKQRVIVARKAAWLFLCGRDILMSGAHYPEEFPVGTKVFVLDDDENVLGFGKIVAPHNSKMRNKVYIKHILDKGEYLRRER
jgi:ribosome biogenesis protein Nip4